jgi:hypothetical protein
MASVKTASKKNEFFCNDCKKEVKIKDGEIVGGVYLSYKEGGQEYRIVKCRTCFKKNKALVDFQPCEVYSRIVGYIRPIQQWNPSKVQEYADRKEFKLSNFRNDCC